MKWPTLQTCWGRVSDEIYCLECILESVHFIKADNHVVYNMMYTRTCSYPCVHNNPEAEFLDVIGTKVFASHTVTSTNGFYPPPSPWAKVVWNWFVMLTLYTETSSMRTLKIMARNLNEIVRSWIRLQFKKKFQPWRGVLTCYVHNVNIIFLQRTIKIKHI
jgi:hypothetical protein